MSESAEPAVVVKNVTKHFRLYHERNNSLKVALMRRGRARYEDFVAVDDVSLDVPEGTTLGLIGPNGSGKSTLLKCMTRILRPEQGSISVRGKLAALLELGAGFHPELSGRDNVYLNGSILGLSRRELDRRFDDIVAFAELDRFIDTPVKNYSSGMYVKLGFSVAINVDPDVLMVDEVLAVGDESFQRKCHEKFSDLREAGKTIVVVSHGLGVVRAMCDSVAWLDHGKLRAIGPASEVVDEYLGQAHVDRVADGEHGSRWGSGEGRIEKIEVVDETGKVTTRVRSGSQVTLRFTWSTSQPLPKAVIGMAIHNIDGLVLAGANCRETDALSPVVVGEGVVEYRMSSLTLLAGTYDITASFTDHSTMHPYDFRYRAARFDVDPPMVVDDLSGYVHLPATWGSGSSGRAVGA